MSPTSIELDPPEAADPATLGVVSLIIAAAAMLAGVWFGFRAWQQETLPDGAYALALLFGAPALALRAILARNFPAGPDHATPVSELLERLHRVEVSLRALRLARAHVYVGTSYAVVLGICLAAGLIGSREFVIIYAATMASAASVYLPWTSRQERRMHEQRSTCRSLLGDHREARAWVIDPSEPSRTP